MKIADYRLYNVGPTPHEIKTLRKEIYDFHKTLGQPVIFKHRWNLDDEKNGKCVRCPYHDQSYHRDKTDCEYCYGTGFLGGFDDGVIIFATIDDAPVDQLKISPQGVVLFERHPQFVAPWYPTMGDGDLIITADFDRATWAILKTNDIFELNMVEPITVRGIFGTYTDYKLYKTQQKADIDRIPNTHIYYSMPIEYERDSVPIVNPPVGAFPSDYNVNEVSIRTVFKLNGAEAGVRSSIKTGIKLTGGGTETQVSRGLYMIGKKNLKNTRVILS